MVFSIEMCAAAAQRANRGGVVTAVTACRGYQWVVVPQVRRLLRLEARQASPGAPWAMRLCADTGEILFACTVELAPSYPSAPPVPPTPPTNSATLLTAHPPTMDLATFNSLTFHGEGYRAMRAIRALDEDTICVDAEVPPFTAMIADLPEVTALATPAPLLDTFGQLTALFALQSRSDVGLFPVTIERIAFFAPPAASGSRCTVQASCEQSADMLRADIDFVDAQGRLNCRIVGAEQRIFDWGPTFRRIVFSTGHNEPFAAISRLDEHLWQARLDDIPAALLTSSNGLWLEVIARCVLGEVERGAWTGLQSAAQARRISWLLGRIAAKSAVLAALRNNGWTGDYADIIIANLASGAPQVRLTNGRTEPGLNLSLSISHCEGCAVALVSTAGAAIGVDVEPADAFAKRGHLAKEIVAPEEAAPEGALQRVGLLRLWCAKEAASKAAGSGLRGRPDHWLTRDWKRKGECWTTEVLAPPADGGQRFIVTLDESGDKMLAVAQAVAQDMKQTDTPESNPRHAGSTITNNRHSIAGA